MIKRNGDLSVLLGDTVQTWYWLGFLTADGTFDVHKGRMRFRLALKDLEILEKFATFISYKGDPAKGVCVQDKMVVQELVKRFGFVNKKTYNPIHLRRDVDDKKMAFYIGLIDGDGCIQRVHKRKDCFITIKMHSSWLGFLEQMERDIYNFLGISSRKGKKLTRVDAEGYSKVSFTDARVVKGLKKFILSSDLFYMSRKWNLIDHEYEGRCERADVLRLKIGVLRERGLSYRKIGKLLNMNHGKIHNLFNGRNK